MFYFYNILKGQFYSLQRYNVDYQAHINVTLSLQNAY